MICSSEKSCSLFVPAGACYFFHSVLCDSCDHLKEKKVKEKKVSSAAPQLKQLGLFLATVTNQKSLVRKMLNTNLQTELLTSCPTQLPDRTWLMDLAVPECLCHWVGKASRAIQEKYGESCRPSSWWWEGTTAGTPGVQLSSLPHGCNESSRFKARWDMQPVSWGKKVQIQLSSTWRGCVVGDSWVSWRMHRLDPACCLVKLHAQ